MSWAAGVFELLGIWLVGNKNRWGFISFIVCNVLWIYVAIHTPEVRGLLIAVVPALFLNIRAWFKWRAK